MANEEIKKALQESGLRFSAGDAGGSEPTVFPFCGQSCTITCNQPCWTYLCSSSLCTVVCLGNGCYGFCSAGCFVGNQTHS